MTEAFPKRVHGLGRAARWQGASGFFYESRREAEADLRENTPRIRRQPLFHGLGLMTIGYFCIVALAQIWTSEIWGAAVPPTWVRWLFAAGCLLYLFVFLPAGMLIVWAYFTGTRQPDEVGDRFLRSYRKFLWRSVATARRLADNVLLEPAFRLGTYLAIVMAIFWLFPSPTGRAVGAVVLLLLIGVAVVEAAFLVVTRWQYRLGGGRTDSAGQSGSPG